MGKQEMTIDVIGRRAEARERSRIRPMIPDWWSVLSCWQRLGKESYLQPQEALPHPRRWQTSLVFSEIIKIFWVTITFASLTTPAAAAYVNFENCLSPNIVNSNPLQLQFVPLHFYASFNTTSPSHNLNVTVYGNVSGVATQVPYPAPDDPQWSKPNSTVGKIVDLSQPNNKYSTLFAKFSVLSYTPYDATPSRFCNATIHGRCPLGPSFTANGSDPLQLPAVTVAHDMYSSYAFTTISTTLRVTSGDASNADLACISASITPDLGSTVTTILTYLPLVILVCVGFATAFAAIYSPWGSADTFRWASNYGRDADLLRLVTPGFGDCLHYIQFIVFAGGLSLNYPGYYQPVVSQASWSVLMFNESFVSHGNGTRSLMDGLYVVNGTYGLDRLSQLVGISTVRDIWAGMVIWLLIILAAVILCIQAWFIFRWAWRYLSNTQEEDLRAKNMPFTVGNVIRILFSYFLLPVVALSMFQLVVAAQSPAFTVALAAILLFVLIGFAGWLLWLIASTRPRSFLFDDLPTVMLYGPLYNTYSDNAATFALIPVFLTFVRGVAIGALQPSGIAQLILLAICEVIFILTLNAFRPFHSPTSMNAYHIFFAVIRLITILLSVAFVPSLGVTEAPRGWIGYVILLMHAIVLVFGFFLNAVQTVIEVAARLAGAGGEEGMAGGAARRGGLVKVFGMRQLSRRLSRRDGAARNSMTSDAAMLGHDSDHKSIQLNDARSRSLSGSSAVLLNRHAASDGRRSVGPDSISAPSAGHPHRGSGSAPYTPTTTGPPNGAAFLQRASPNAGVGGSPRGGILGLKSAEAADPYYRPPRGRRTTLETNLPGDPSRRSWNSGDWANKDWSRNSPEQGEAVDLVEIPPASGRVTPIPAYLGAQRDTSDPNVSDQRGSPTDYAVREVDFYYGVRGPALSNLPTRRLKTGPADPTGPVSSATGWIKGLFGGKTKDKGKGFEVVRSSRVPPSLGPHVNSEATTVDGAEPYRDNPQVTGAERSRTLDLSDEGDAIGGGTRRPPDKDMPSPASSDENDTSDLDSEEHEESGGARLSQISHVPPILPNIDTGGEIELPSRIASKASSKPSYASTSKRARRSPILPQRSSRRQSSSGQADFVSAAAPRLATVGPTPPSSPPRAKNFSYGFNRSLEQRLEPTNTPSRLPFESKPSSTHSDRLSTGAESTSSSVGPIPGEERTGQSAAHVRHSSSVLGSLAPDTRNDRPSSMGYVQQHRASDAIHKASPDDQSFLGSTAELVDDDKRRSGSTELRI